METWECVHNPLPSHSWSTWLRLWEGRESSTHAAHALPVPVLNKGQPSCWLEPIFPTSVVVCSACLPLAICSLRLWDLCRLGMTPLQTCPHLGKTSLLPLLHFHFYIPSPSEGKSHTPTNPHTHINASKGKIQNLPSKVTFPSFFFFPFWSQWEGILHPQFKFLCDL